VRQRTGTAATLRLRNAGVVATQRFGPAASHRRRLDDGTRVEITRLEPETERSPTMKPDPSSLLRNTLRADAAVCALAGIDLLAFSGMAADLLGIPRGATLPIIGSGLLAYAAYLIAASRREPLSLTEAWAFATGDLLWIAGSAALIAFGPLSTSGKWLVGAVAVVVLAFAELKMLGIRRIRQAHPRLAFRHEAA
jgi:hypothetical protein